MKVFIVEDEPRTRQELMELVGATEGLELAGQAGSVREALSTLETSTPEAVTLDISLPDGSGVEVLKQIRKRGWAMRVIVLTGNPYEALRTKCLQLGAAAVLDKFDALAQVRQALLSQWPCVESA